MECWVKKGNGQHGDGTTRYRYSPVKIVSAVTVTSSVYPVDLVLSRYHTTYDVMMNDGIR